MPRPRAGKKTVLKCPEGDCYDDDSDSSSFCSDSDCSDCYECVPKKRKTSKKSTSTKIKPKSKSKPKKKTTRRARDSSTSCSCSDCMDYSSDDCYDCAGPSRRRPGNSRKCPY